MQPIRSATNRQQLLTERFVRLRPGALAPVAPLGSRKRRPPVAGTDVDAQSQCRPNKRARNKASSPRSIPPPCADMWLALPPEMVAHMLSFIDHARDIANLGASCHSWAAVVGACSHRRWVAILDAHVVGWRSALARRLALGLALDRAVVERVDSHGVAVLDTAELIREIDTRHSAALAADVPLPPPPTRARKRSSVRAQIAKQRAEKKTADATICETAKDSEAAGVVYEWDELPPDATAFSAEAVHPRFALRMLTTCCLCYGSAKKNPVGEWLAGRARRPRSLMPFRDHLDMSPYEQPPLLCKQCAPWSESMLTRTSAAAAYALPLDDLFQLPHVLLRNPHRSGGLYMRLYAKPVLMAYAVRQHGSLLAAMQHRAKRRAINAKAARTRAETAERAKGSTARTRERAV